MLFDLLAMCVSISMCCLTIFYAVKAQEHTLLERAAELSTLRINVGALAQQQLDNLVVASIRCPLECAAVVSALAQQQLDNLVVASK